MTTRNQLSNRIRAGTRSSCLAVIQAESAIHRLAAIFHPLKFELIRMSSPGDEDRRTELQQSASDFFTRYLDDAVESGELDCAVHSAKDLPDPIRGTLDWWWLPWREDPRDVLVLRAGESACAMSQPVVGISSDRRAAYCGRRFPDATIRSVRGNVDDRLAQLDRGEVDILITAAAALNRLGLADRVSEYIAVSDLRPPPGQGVLALTFRKDDVRLQGVRSLFVRAVRLVGGGPGAESACTVAGVEALRHCDTCFYDALVARPLLRHLQEDAEAVDVGKRSGAYAVPRDVLDGLQADHVRRGSRVVRLKGGDPGIYGRLAEEVDNLTKHSLPFRVIPGVSSLNAATTGTGHLLTRRGIARGFTVITPRLACGGVRGVGADARAGLPIAIFMAVGKVPEIVEDLLGEGMPGTQPAAMVFAAGCDEETIVYGTLATIASRVHAAADGQPGLLLVGDLADPALAYSPHIAALAGVRVLVTGSVALLSRSVLHIEDYCGTPVLRPLMRLVPDQACCGILGQLNDFDWVTLTSPSAVRCLMAMLNGINADIRRIPRILASGEGVCCVLREYGLIADVVPAARYGAVSLLQAAAAAIQSGDKVLRLRSNLADTTVADALRAHGAEVTDCVLYRNEAIAYQALPKFDAVMFCSGSAVRSFVASWGVAALADKVSVVIGGPTSQALRGLDVEPDVVAEESSVAHCVQALAAYYVNRRLKELTA